MNEREKEEFLMHFGVKGMKWGVRRTEEQLAAASEAVGAGGELVEDLGDEVMGNDSISDELGDVIDIVLGGDGNIEKELVQLKDAVKDKLEDVTFDILERGETILSRLAGKPAKVSYNRTLGVKTTTDLKTGKKTIVDMKTGKGVSVKKKDGVKLPQLVFKEPQIKISKKQRSRLKDR